MSAGVKIFWALVVLALAIPGIEFLIEARAHGEPPIAALLILALPLLMLGWIVVRIGQLFLRGWRDGEGAGQKAVVGLAVALIAGGGLYVYVQSTVQAQRPSMELTAALAPACRGVAVAGAGTVDTTGTKLNHMVILDTDGNEHAWTGYAPMEWRPAELADAEFVACISPEEAQTQIQVCQYVNGPPITRYRVSRNVRIVEAATGRIVAEYPLTDDPRACGASEPRDLTVLSGEITWGMVESTCSCVVETGEFAEPTNSPDDWQPGDSTPSGPPDLAPTEPPTGETIELRGAIAAGLIAVEPTGAGLESVSLDIASLTSEPLTVLVEAGTFFDPQRSQTQSMVVTQTTEIDLQAEEDGTWSVPVACAKMRRDPPGASDTFTIRAANATGDLARLLDTPRLTTAPFRVQQFAVWTITNDPARSRYVGLGTGLTLFGSGPTKDEFRQLRSLFEAAGINPGDYRALR